MTVICLNYHMHNFYISCFYIVIIKFCFQLSSGIILLYCCHLWYINITNTIALEYDQFCSTSSTCHIIPPGRPLWLCSRGVFIKQGVLYFIKTEIHNFIYESVCAPTHKHTHTSINLSSSGKWNLAKHKTYNKQIKYA